MKYVWSYYTINRGTYEAMEDNTVFQSNQQPKETAQQASQIETARPVPSSSPPPPPQTPQPLRPSQPPPSSFDPSLYEEPFPWGMVLKIGIGIVFLVVFVFLIYTFVIPKFRAQKKENVVLTYWGLWEDEAVMRSVISDFEKQNPTIKVTYVKQDPKQYRDRIIARSQNGLGPDIFRFHNTWLPMMSSMLLPLSEDVISKKDFEKNYYSVMARDLTRNGALYGIPLGIDTLSLFVNTDILQSAGFDSPKTWDEFINISKQVTVPDSSTDGKIKTAGAALGTYDNITHAPDIISLLFTQNGADVRSLLKTPEKASDTLSFYSKFAQPPNNVWDNTQDSSILAFAKGNLAMYFGYSWDIFQIKEIDPSLKFKIVDVPHVKGRDITIASYWAEGVYSKTKHAQAAFTFMNYLTKKETLIKLYSEESKTRLFGELYPRVDMADLLKDNSLLYPFVRQAKNAVSTPFSSDTKDNGLNEKSNVYLGNGIRAVLGNTSPQSAVETLSAGVDQVFKQYGQ